jgi:hypothetical protein
MPDQRKFSRARHRIKLNQREEIESELRQKLTPMLREAAPSAPPGALGVVADLLAVVASQMLAQTQATQRSLKTLDADMPEYATAFVEQMIELAGQDLRAGARKLKAKEIVPPDGALVTPDWAGPVAGPTVLERHFGIPRSTLYRWQKRLEVVWLNTRTSRKPVFPLKQFVDGRPAHGIAEIVQAFGEPRPAWKWLLEKPDMSDGPAPIDLVLDGRWRPVVDAAVAAARSARSART